MSRQHVDEVSVGTWVKVTGFVPGEEEVFHLVPEPEADYHQNKIPPTSPLAVALAGARPGDRIPFHPPEGDVELTVLEIGPREAGSEDTGAEPAATSNTGANSSTDSRKESGSCPSSPKSES